MHDKLLQGRYEIIEKLGSGGMAIVYKARDIVLHRYVTVKVLRPEYTADENFVQRFQSEAQAVACLSHPNIVSIHDVGQDKETYFLVMEYIDGNNLKTIISNNGAFLPREAVEICRQVCKALEHAHENNIVHQDVKPHNILITRTGQIKLTDFGIARRASTATYTNSNTIMGSVHYLSPEQAKGHLAGPESDLYSLGVVLFEMLTGELPFTAESGVGVAVKHVKEEPARPSEVKAKIPKSLDNIVMRALAKNKSARYQTAREMLVDLNKYLSGKAVEYRAGFYDDDKTRIIPVVGGEDAAPDSFDAFAKERKKKVILYASLTVMLVVFASLIGFYLLKDYVSVPEVSVPSVQGMQWEEAQETLEEAGLKAEIEEVFDATVPKGEVIKQDIENISVKAHRVITLTVSKGAESVVVPSTLRYKPEDAETIIRDSGLVPGEVREEYNDDVPKGFVFKTDPADGTEVGKGSKILIYVSAGSEPEAYAMPDLTAMNTEKAGLILRTLGLKISEDIQFVSSDEYLAGQIVEQEPRKNTEVKAGMTVTLTVSSGPGPSGRAVDVTIPVEDDGKNHDILISVEDVRGTTEAYVGTHPAGDVVTERVTYFGAAKIRVYIDHKLKKEYVL